MSFQDDQKRARIRQESLFFEADQLEKKGKIIQARETRSRASVLGYLWGIEAQGATA